jgi:glucosamine kinase
VLFAGIDGGQSSTSAAIGDGERILSRGLGGPADEVAADSTSTRLRDALEGALADALRAAGLPAQTRFDAIVAGVSGYEGHLYGHAPRMPAARFVLMHDAPIAHAGALRGEPGIVVIAGTGSVGYAVARDGRTRVAGGLGYLFGDEGSAFWIARAAFTRAVAHDGCPSAARISAFFGVAGLREVARAFYAGAISRDRFAAFAPVCVAAAAANDACACLRDPVDAAAIELARLARRAALDPLPATTVAFTGGLMRDMWFRSRVHASSSEQLAGCTIVEPAGDACEGALRLAARA